MGKILDKRWVMKAGASPEVVAHLGEALGVDERIAALLGQRGISTFDEAKEFFRPKLEELHDPFLMKGMDKAVARIEAAIAQKENILIFGDYDVDGTTAVAFTYSFFSKIHDRIDYYIPDRYKEGYGVSTAGIDYAADNDIKLIIALDCGIRSMDKVQYAKEKGIDFIICDHHLPGDELPDAVAILDPKQADCEYPYKELCGCGIGFKLAQAYSIKNGLGTDLLYDKLELTAVSIAADIVPITGENRVLAYYGLQKLNEAPCVGIQAILGVNKVTKELAISDVVFIIAPRINAAGRIDHGRKAVELLLTEDAGLATDIAKRINEDNLVRRGLDEQITQHALELIEKDAFYAESRSTVVFHQEWHKGVIGIVASRLIERHYKPTIVLGEADGYVTGSARSVKGFDVYQAIEMCSDLLEQFGGHKYAAGLKMKPENVEAFRQKFEQVVAASIEEHHLVPIVEIDSAIDFEEITPKFLRILNQFAPFGPGNMKPVFIARNVVDRGFAKIVGNDHLKLDVYPEDRPNLHFAAIAFGQGDHFAVVSRRTPMDICFTIEENEWNGNKTIQLNIKDMRPSVN